ncbi:hypothetical protein GOP47_0028357 [Adiantum capillus-veneris]|nr:hypothetical protein GOP47_0028357 [Adiantum capillus-veneris]
MTAEERSSNESKKPKKLTDDIVNIFVADDLYANAQPRADWFRSRWDGIESKELTNTTAFKETNVDDSKANRQYLLHLKDRNGGGRSFECYGVH